MSLRGVVPSPSSDELNVVLTYVGAKMTFDIDKQPGYVVADFPQGVFTLVAPYEDWPLTLYALPASVTVKKQDNGAVAGTFQAKLTGPRPGVTVAAGAANTLKATLNCKYKYSL